MACFPQSVREIDPFPVRCAACGHRVVWPVVKAVALLGASTGPVFAAAKLKCSACGVKGQIAFD